jgi:hypothetical protein
MDDAVILSREDLRSRLAEIQERMDNYPLDDDYDERELYLDGGREDILKRLLGEEA